MCHLPAKISESKLRKSRCGSYEDLCQNGNKIKTIRSDRMWCNKMRHCPQLFQVTPIIVSPNVWQMWCLKEAVKNACPLPMCPEIQAPGLHLRVWKPLDPAKTYLGSCFSSDNPLSAQQGVQITTFKRKQTRHECSTRNMKLQHLKDLLKHCNQKTPKIYSTKVVENLNKYKEIQGVLLLSVF